jgi:hypothetical protein
MLDIFTARVDAVLEELRRAHACRSHIPCDFCSMSMSLMKRPWSSSGLFNLSVVGIETFDGERTLLILIGDGTFQFELLGSDQLQTFHALRITSMST